jgi:phosphoglycolate phosphatase
MYNNTVNRVLLFDFDGTIADSFENFLDILDKLTMKYNLPVISREKLEEMRDEEPMTLIKKLKIPFYKIPFIGKDMKKMQQQQIAEIKPIKSLPEVLIKLKILGYKLGIVTSNGKENVELFLKKNNLEVFDYIYSDSSLFGKDKVISKFLKQTAVLSENVLYIGDEIRDIQACKKVGIKIIAVTWGFNLKAGLAKYHPDFLIDKPEELLKLINAK